MPTFLTDAWFERARALVVGRGSLPGIGYRIQFVAGGERWYQVAVDGAIVEWVRGDVDEPDLEIVMPLEIATRIHRASIDGSEALAACQVRTPDGRSTRPMPIDIVDRPEVGDLPHQPDAGIVVPAGRRASRRRTSGS
jgi:hypothetical protein